MSKPPAAICFDMDGVLVQFENHWSEHSERSYRDEATLLEGVHELLEDLRAVGLD